MYSYWYLGTADSYCLPHMGKQLVLLFATYGKTISLTVCHIWENN